MSLPSRECIKLYFSTLYDSEMTKKNKTNILDAVWFEHGKPVLWLFTSEKTGEVLKKKTKRLNLHEIIATWRRRVHQLHGRRVHCHVKSKIAHICFRGEHDDSPPLWRVADEAELTFLLSHNLFAQEVLCVVCFMPGYPLKGSGIFEHHITRVTAKDKGKTLHHSTTELVAPLEPVDIYELSKLVNEEAPPVSPFDHAHFEAAAVALATNEVYPTEGNERALIITETQHEYLTPIAAKVFHMLEKKHGAPLHSVVLMYSFNSTWCPLLIGVRSISDTISGSSSPHMTRPLRKPIRSLKSVAADTSSSATGAQLSKEHTSSIPVPVATMPVSAIDYSAGEVTTKRIDRSRQRRQSVIENYITYGKKAVPGSSKTNKPQSSGKHCTHQRAALSDNGTKQYMQYTNNWSRKLHIYADQLHTPDDTRQDVQLEHPDYHPPHYRSMPVSRPHSAPSTRTSQRYKNPTVDTKVKGEGLTKKLPLQSNAICNGDYCTVCYGKSDEDILEDCEKYGLVMHTGADGVEKLRSQHAEYQVSCKSILLARAECKFLGEHVIGVDASFYGFDKNEVLSQCALHMIRKIDSKCGADAFSTMLQANKSALMSSLQASAAIYRNLIYTDALSTTHPSRFYYTQPVCQVCSDMYRYLDMYRNQIIFKSEKRSTVRPKSADMRTRIANTRERLKLHADAIRGIDTSFTLADSEDKEEQPSRPTSARLAARKASPSVNPTLAPELGTSADIPSSYSGATHDIGPVTNKVIGNKASGLMSSWVDLLASKHRPRPVSASPMPSKFPKASDPKYTSVKLIEKRKEIVRNRADKQWHEDLRFGDGVAQQPNAAHAEPIRRHVGRSFEEFDNPEHFLGHVACKHDGYVEEDDENSIALPGEHANRKERYDHATPSKFVIHTRQRPHSASATIKRSASPAPTDEQEVLRLLRIKDTILKSNAANRLHLDGPSQSKGPYAYGSLPFTDSNVHLLSNSINASTLEESSNSLLTSDAGLSTLMI